MGGLSGALAYARDSGAEAVQVFVSNPRGWAPAVVDPLKDEAFRVAAHAAKIPLFIHAPYLVNLASPTHATLHNSLASVGATMQKAASLDARAVVVHAGSCVDAGHRDAALGQFREHLLPLLDRLPADGPKLLIEPMAGGGECLASSVSDLAPLFDAVDHHPMLGVCLDTCHGFAAGHDLAAPGGVRAWLNELVRTLGRGRLGLVHANDSKDGVGSSRDRHESIGAGRIGAEPFGELFRHPATRGVPVLVETPGKVEGHAADIALLKSLRDR
ncbi:MAG: deoxyribonuclease [Frankiales bacterium]|nr:deoxyribonuclease [Frankiales bacterium]